MHSISVFRANWKVRLVAFGLGMLVAAAAFGIALVVSDDLRLLYVSGALLLAFAAFLLGAWAMARRRHSLCNQSARVRCRFALHPAKFLCSIFSPPGVLHVLQSCRNWSVFVPIFRPAAISNSSSLAPIAAVIRPSGCARLRNVAKFPLPVAFDPDRKTMRAFGLSGFPNLVVIDRTGRVRLTHTGYNSSETSFRRDLTQLLQSL